MYYMVREPEYESTLLEYLKSGGCGAKFLLCSRDYDKARHIISCEYAKLKVVNPRVVKPERIMTLIGLSKILLLGTALPSQRLVEGMLGLLDQLVALQRGSQIRKD